MIAARPCTRGFIWQLFRKPLRFQSSTGDVKCCGTTWQKNKISFWWRGGDKKKNGFKQYWQIREFWCWHEKGLKLLKISFWLLAILLFCCSGRVNSKDKRLFCFVLSCFDSLWEVAAHHGRKSWQQQESGVDGHITSIVGRQSVMSVSA